MTIRDMKIGSVLIFGKYGVNNDFPKPIAWLKASQNCDFITQYALDYICFDAREPSEHNRFTFTGGNPDYSLSNIARFINSVDREWYSQSHERDTPPSRVLSRTDHMAFAYDEHFGFLYHFSDYELDRLDTSRGLMRLPSTAEVLNGNFELFHKKGRRVRASEDLKEKISFKFEENSFLPFWIADSAHESYSKIIGRSGYAEIRSPYMAAGLRPVCRITANTEIVDNNDGTYSVVETDIDLGVCSIDELTEFLGYK